MRTKEYLKLGILILFYFSIQKTTAQITTNDKPYSFLEKSVLPVRDIVELEIPNMQEIKKEDAINDKNEGLQRISVPIYVSFNANKNGEWINLPNGGSLWRLTLSAVGAKSLDFSFDKFWLPDGGKFFIYNQETKEYIGAITNEFIQDNKENPSDFSTGIVLGEQITLEYYQDLEIKDKPIINISAVYYGYRYVDKNSVKGFGDSGNCQVNINCSEGVAWQQEKKAVARIYVKTPTGGGWCSGSLMNNTRNNLEPLFLTANHCLADVFDAINSPNLSQWIFYWHYEHPSCANSNTEPTIYSTVGATVKANNSVSDFALLT